MKFHTLVSGASAWMVGMQPSPVQYAPSAVQYASPAFLAPNSGVPVMVVDNGVPLYELPYEPSPQSAGNMGTLMALCGLGALGGYALGRNKAAFGTMGKPARAVPRIAAPTMAELGNDKNDVETSVKMMVAEQLGVKPRGKVTLEKKLKEDFGAEYFDIAELTMWFEDEWGIEITDEELDSFKTGADCVKVIKAKWQPKAEAPKAEA
jgi:acyl carrier protein